MVGGGVALRLGATAENGVGSKVSAGTDVGVDAMVAGAVAANVLAGTSVGSFVGVSGDSVPWHAAAINATPHNNVSHCDIARFYHLLAADRFRSLTYLPCISIKGGLLFTTVTSISVSTVS